MIAMIRNFGERHDNVGTEIKIDSDENNTAAHLIMSCRFFVWGCAYS